MADNYLEKRYDELFGRGAVRPAAFHHPSLDALVARCIREGVPDESYPVHPSQMDAILAAGRRHALCEPLTSNRIAVCGPAFEAGRAFEAMTLKAADLGLDTALVSGQEGTAVLAIGKK